MLNISLLAFLFSLSVFADTSDQKSFVYDGSFETLEVFLRSEKSHTEYRVENRPSTCYRPQIVGHRSICVGEGRRSGPNPRPFPAPRQCWSEPVIRTVPYSCIRPVNVEYQVKDYDVYAQVFVDIKNLSPQINPQETIFINLRGEILSVEAKGSKKFFILKNRFELSERRFRKTKEIRGRLDLALVDASPYVGALNISELRFNNGELSFRGQNWIHGIGFKLKVEKLRFLASNKLIFERDLLSHEVTSTQRGEGVEHSLNLAQIAPSLGEGKYKINLVSFLQFNTPVINAEQFLDESKNISIKTKK
jgi:hypothetical protein